MDTENQPKEKICEFKFKMAKAEKILSFAIFILFFLSFTRPDNVFLNIGFFGMTGLIMLYYFIWYRKKPEQYIILKEGEILVNQLPFFKQVSIKKENIKNISSTDKKIIVEYSDENIQKKLNIFYLFIDEKDKKNLRESLKTYKK